MEISQLRESTMKALLDQEVARNELERLAQAASLKREAESSELKRLRVTVGQEREIQRRMKASPRRTLVKREVVSRSSPRGVNVARSTGASPRHTTTRTHTKRVERTVSNLEGWQDGVHFLPRG